MSIESADHSSGPSPGWPSGGPAERDFFAGLENQRAHFLRRAVRRRLRRNDLVFFEGDPGDACFYIASGLVRIFSVARSSKEPIFFLRRPGEMFGLSEALNGLPRQANAQALAPTELYAMPGTEFDRLLAEDYALARRVITVLGGRVRYLRARISDLISCGVMSRLIHLLLFLVSDLLSDAGAWEGPVTLSVRISQEQLAAMIGSTQPTVSDLLRALQDEGLIAVERRRITIPRPLLLLARAQKMPEG